MSARRPMGLHVQGAHDRAAAYIAAVRPSVVKFLDDAPPPLVSLVNGYGGLSILRVYRQDQDAGNFGEYLKDIERAARGSAVRAIEVSHNEAHQAGDELTVKAELDIAGMKLAERLGKIGVIGCFSVGMPDLAEWPRYRPALEYAAAHGHLLGIHEYGGGPDGMDAGITGAGKDARGWFCLRYRRVLDWARSVGLTMPRIVITEAGIDDLSPGIPQKTRGYQTAKALHPPHVGDYAAQAARYARHLAEDAGAVVGWVDFGFGAADPAWHAFDLSRDGGMLDRMIAEMSALPDTGAPKPPKEVPPVADLHAMLLAEFGPGQYEDLRAQMADRPGFNTRPLSGVDAIAIHHTVGPKSGTWPSVRDGHWARGFSGIGYHLGIRQGKLAYLGDVSKARACVAQQNHKLICLVFTGDYTKEQPDAADLEIARRAIKVLDAYLGRRPVLRGHRDYMATECPGPNLYAHLAGLRSGTGPSLPPVVAKPNLGKIAWFAEDVERRMKAEGLTAEAAHWRKIVTAPAIKARDAR